MSTCKKMLRSTCDHDRTRGTRVLWHCPWWTVWPGACLSNVDTSGHVTSYRSHRSHAERSQAWEGGWPPETLLLTHPRHAQSFNLRKHQTFANCLNFTHHMFIMIVFFKCSLNTNILPATMLQSKEVHKNLSKNQSSCAILKFINYW